MTRHLRPARALAAAPLLLVLALTGCGADDGADDAVDAVDTPAGADTPAAGDTADDAGSTEDGGASADPGSVAGACLEGATVCADIPTGTGGVVSGPDGSVGVGDAVAAGVQGPFLVSGYLVSGPDGTRLCEALAESLPPQCGGTSVLLEPADVPDGATTTTEGDVTWSTEPVLVEGELQDGTFVVRTG